MCIYKTSLLHRPDKYNGFTSSCPPHILQQNCAHGDDYLTSAFWRRAVFVLSCQHRVFLNINYFVNFL